MGIDGEDGVAGAFGGETPVVGAAAAPAGSVGGGVVRLVAEVHAEDGGVVGVAAGEHLPVGDPGGFGVALGEPEAAEPGAVAGLGAVVVEDDLEALVAGVGDDLVEDLERVQTLEVSVDGGAGAAGEFDLGGDGGGFDHLVGEGDADGVVAAAADALDDGAVVLLAEASGDGGFGLKAVPVDAGDADGAVGGVENLVATCVPEAVTEPGLHSWRRVNR